ncbi:uncharacterized protein EV422DRAFT_572453 [Fimicolochytrium jonesii]|uniref:uncharacterized protein n=1 Tax=Fimicolochytrium jonesii TaxID=1396493 RepID=UPI0022FE6F0C|nr:uncharacterized protein EV422DRAFT_572453 [Fimicolochytrium jonesii]KAI8815751.1 hypothetical protein EV422DRAFT_572453 [Fimicolochytrium jonesii]
MDSDLEHSESSTDGKGVEHHGSVDSAPYKQPQHQHQQQQQRQIEPSRALFTFSSPSEPQQQQYQSGSPWGGVGPSSAGGFQPSANAFTTWSPHAQQLPPHDPSAGAPVSLSVGFLPPPPPPLESSHILSDAEQKSFAEFLNAFENEASIEPPPPRQQQQGDVVVEQQQHQQQRHKPAPLEIGSSQQHQQQQMHFATVAQHPASEQRRSSLIPNVAALPYLSTDQTSIIIPSGSPNRIKSPTVLNPPQISHQQQQQQPPARYTMAIYQEQHRLHQQQMQARSMHAGMGGQAPQGQQHVYAQLQQQQQQSPRPSSVVQSMHQSPAQQSQQHHNQQQLISPMVDMQIHSATAPTTDAKSATPSQQQQPPPGSSQSAGPSPAPPTNSRKRRSTAQIDTSAFVQYAAKRRLSVVSQVSSNANSPASAVMSPATPFSANTGAEGDASGEASASAQSQPAVRAKQERNTGTPMTPTASNSSDAPGNTANKKGGGGGGGGGGTGTGGTGSGKQLLTESEKRANHIESEKKRRQNIRDGFDQLVEIVPGLGQCQRSESVILQKSVEYVEYLLRQQAELQARVGHARAMLGMGVPGMHQGGMGPPVRIAGGAIAVMRPHEVPMQGHIVPQQHQQQQQQHQHLHHIQQQQQQLPHTPIDPQNWKQPHHPTAGAASSASTTSASPAPSPRVAQQQQQQHQSHTNTPPPPQHADSPVQRSHEAEGESVQATA